MISVVAFTLAFLSLSSAQAKKKKAANERLLLANLSKLTSDFLLEHKLSAEELNHA